MNIIIISNAKDYIDKEIKIQGWMYNKRSSGKLHFLQIRDGSGFIQAIVFKDNVSEELFQKAEQLTIESSLVLTGKISKHPKKDEYELQVSDIEIVCLNDDDDYPISKKDHGPEFLLDNRHLWLRSKKQWAIQRVRNTIINAIFEYLNNEGFIKIDAPIFTPNACEGTTTLFEVDYFGTPIYLTQSGQLYIEAAIFAHGKVFDFGPVFRAEKSKTRRHLIEFWMMDAEAAFVTHDENMKIQEGIVTYIISSVLEKNQKEFELIGRDIEPLKKIKSPFYRKTHKEVVKELREMGSEIEEDDDLGATDETMLMEKYDKPLFIEKYPAEVKAFYMKRDYKDLKYVLCDDLLAPEGYGEIIGGSEREDNYDELLSRIKDYKLNIKNFQWYLDLRKYGSVPHSGFGIGLERMVAWICGLHHVRETIPFPRMLNRINP